jgi:signal transduction histidine kinase
MPPGDLPEEHKTCIYRLVQEALHNSARHAMASLIRVLVTQEDHALYVIVQDDGRGFDPRFARGLGLLGMEERVRHLGGTLRIYARPGEGALLRAELPVNFTAISSSRGCE